MMFLPGLPESRQRRPVLQQRRRLLLAEGDVLLWHRLAGLDDHFERRPAQLHRRLGHRRLLHCLRLPGHQHLSGHPVRGVPPWARWVGMFPPWKSPAVVLLLCLIFSHRLPLCYQETLWSCWTPAWAYSRRCSSTSCRLVAATWAWALASWPATASPPTGSSPWRGECSSTSLWQTWSVSPLRIPTWAKCLLELEKVKPVSAKHI